MNKSLESSQEIKQKRTLQYSIWALASASLLVMLASLVRYLYNRNGLFELIISSGLLVILVLVNNLIINLRNKERENKLFSEYQVMRHSADQLAMLNDIGRAITTLGDLNSVLDIIRAQVQRILPVDAFIVLLYHPGTNMVSFPLVYDNGRNWPEPDRELGPNMKSYDIIKNTGRSILINLTQQEFEENLKTENRSLMGDHTMNYRSFLYAPLVRQNNVIGVVSAINYDFNMYTSEHLKLLEGVAIQATIAIENTRLYQAQQKELLERKQAEAEVRTLNVELEQRVQKRTVQLQEANENLNYEKALLEQYNHQREIMSKMIDLLQASFTTREAAEIIISHLKLLFPGNDGALYLINTGNMLEPIALWGSRTSLDITYSIDECWGMRRGIPYLFGTDLPNPPCSHVGKSITQYALCIPLSAQGENIGTLHLSSPDQRATLEDNDPKIAIIVANSIALSLANLRFREKLHFQSIRDGLTGLFNRRYLDETLPREINRTERSNTNLSALLFDIDHFKDFNDTYGHDAGDLILKEMAQVILSGIRESDIACRYGGEEFVIILPNTTIEIAEQRAKSLCSEVSGLDLQLHGKKLGQVTISVGVVTHPQHGRSRDDLIKSADEAMYQAKANGRNCVVVREF